MRKLWTEEENQLIKTLRQAGLTYKQMVPHFPGRKQGSISMQASKLLEPSRVLKAWTPEEEEQLIELRLAKVPYKDIAEILGRSYSAVKTKGSYIITSQHPRPASKKPMSTKKEEAFSDLSTEELAYVEDGQLYFKL